MSTVININGTDRTTDINWRSLAVNREISTKQSVAEFQMVDLTTLPQSGDFFELWEDTDLIFSGLVLDHENIGPLPQKDSQVSVSDFYDMLVRRYIRSTYTNKTFNEIVQDIINTRIHTDELKLMLQFEEGTGTSITDLTQFDNDATINGAGYTWDTTNHALSLDGSNGTYVSIPDDGSLDFSTQMSICVEVTMDNLFETIIVKDASAAGGNFPYRIFVDYSGDINFRVSDSTGSYSVQTTDQPISAGTKYTIICTFDKTTGMGKIYVDGILNKSGTLTTNSLLNSTGNILIGSDSTFGEQGAWRDLTGLQGFVHDAPSAMPEPNFDGKIFRVSAYAKVLTAIECRRWHIDTLEVKAPTRLMAEYDSIIDRVNFPFMYPSEAFDILCRRLGLDWRIDERCFLNFLDRAGGSSVATFDEDDGTTLRNTVSVDTSVGDIRNAVYVRGGTYLGTWRSDVLKANGSNTVFSLPYKYSGFELFTDTASLCADVQSKFKMNDASGNLSDEKSANTLTAANLTYSQTGQVGDAIDFNGTTSSARKTGATHDTGDTAHSITAIIQPDVHDATERIIAGFGDFSAGHSKLSLILSGGTYYLRVNFGDSLTFDVDVGDLSGAWHMVGVSYDPAASAGPTAKVYLDGQLQNTTVLSSAIDIDAGVMEIGGNNGSNVFDGDIDEVSFFKYNLSDQEMEAMYNIAFTSTLSAMLLRSGVEFINDAADFDGLYNFSEKNYKFSTAPSDGVLLYPSGFPEIPVQALRTDSASINTHGRRELQITDTTIESLQGARDRARAEVLRRKDPKQKVEFETYTSGINPGDTIAVTFPGYDVPSGNFFVQSISLTPHLKITNSDGVKHKYKIICVNVVSKDWVDYLRSVFVKADGRIDPTEGEGIADITDHAEAIDCADTHTVKTPTDHAEAMDVDDSHTLNTVTSGSWKWSNDAGTTPDKLRWNLGDWG